VIAVNKILKQFFFITLYSAVFQLFTPPPQLQALSDLIVLVNLQGNVLQHFNSGLTLFKPAYFTGSF